MEMEKTEILVEVWHDYQKYLIPESQLKEADALGFPDGTVINLRQCGVEHDNTCEPSRYRLVSETDSYRDWGRLPTLNLLRVAPVVQ